MDNMLQKTNGEVALMYDSIMSRIGNKKCV